MLLFVAHIKLFLSLDPMLHQLAVDKAEEALDSTAKSTPVETATRHTWSLSENKFVQVNARNRVGFVQGNG